MSSAVGPDIVNDGLIFCIDAANQRSLPYQNFLLQSENIHLSPWGSTGNATRTQTNILGPLGYGLATRVLTSTTSPSLIFQTVSTNIIGTERMVCSVYAKADTANIFTFNCYYGGDTEVNINFNLSNGTAGSGGIIENVGNGWYKCTIEVPARVNSGTNFAWRIWPEPRSSATGIGCLFWGAQLTKKYAPKVYVKTESSIVYSGDIINEVLNNIDNLTIYGNPSYTSDMTINLSDNQVTQYLMNSNFPNPTTTVTYSIWFKSRFYNPTQTPFTYSVSGNNEMLFYTSDSTTISPFVKGSAQNFTVSDMTNKWINFVWTSNRASGDEKYYINGELVGSRNYLPGTLITSGGYLIIGQESDSPGGGFHPGQNLDGEFSQMSIYNKILTDSEVKQNFNATRGRYGI